MTLDTEPYNKFIEISNILFGEAEIVSVQEFMKRTLVQGAPPPENLNVCVNSYMRVIRNFKTVALGRPDSICLQKESPLDLWAWHKLIDIEYKLTMTETDNA